MKVRKPIKKLIMIVLAVSITLAICLTGCFNKTNPEKVDLGERYDSDKILVRDDGISFDKDSFVELFDKYNKATSETEFVVHENTAIAIAEAVMRELYPDDNYGVVHYPTYYRPLYSKVENCWEVWLHRNALFTKSISESDPKTDKVMFVYVDVHTGAVKAIIPADEFSVHNPANSD